MKHYVLVFLNAPPKEETNKIQAYRALLADKLHRSNMPDERKERLSENCWLLERETSTSTLAKIVSEAEAYGIAHQVKFLSEE